MKKTGHNFCIRCGKERKIIRTWKEKMYDSIIINTESVCPDPQCQKKVDSENKKQHDKNDAIKQRSEKRALDRQAERTANKKKKNKK